MTSQEAALHQKRIEKFNRLVALRDAYSRTLRQITEPWPDTGPCGQGPFTRNIREARMILTLTIGFSKTRGGAAPVAMEISEGLDFEASDFGAMLADEVGKRLAKIDEEIKAL